MVLVGNLEELPLPDLIQFYCAGRQTARLTLSYPDAEAQLFFQGGALVDARCGALEGVEAVYAAMGRTGGSFRADVGILPAARTITEHWSVVVMEGSRLLDEERRRAEPSIVKHVAAGAETPVSRPEGVVRPLRAVERSESNMRPVITPKASQPPRGAPRKLLLAIGIPAVIAAGLALAFLLQPKAAPPAPPAAVAITTPFTLGMSSALTGPSKELGRQMKLGVETAFGVVNAAGGVNGRKLDLIALDDGYEPARTKDAMKELVEGRKVFAIIGNVGTPTAEVAVPYALEKKVLFFGAFTGAGLLRKEPPDRYVFNYRASYAEETATVVRWLVEVKKIKPSEIAVFAQQDGFGDAGFAGVARALRKYGRAPDEILRVGFKRNTLELQEAVDTIVKNRKQVRAIVTVAPYRPAAKFIEKMRDSQIDAIISNVSFVGSTALAEELRQIGPKYSTGIIVTQVVPPIDSSSTAVLKYREALAKTFPGEKPDFVSLEGYIAANIFVEGLRRAGRNATPETLIDALENIHDLDPGIGTKINFGPSEHQGSHKVWGTVLNESAQYQVLDLE